MYKCKVKEDKGITLIALIVTIVALLIISGVTISSITDSENGVIENAKSAKDEAEKSEEYINVQKAVMKIKALSPTGLIDTENLREKLISELEGIIGNGRIKYTKTDKLPWNVKGNNGEYTIGESGNTAGINYITRIQIPNSTKPYLPEGFSISQESMNDEEIKAGGALEKGLVVKDSHNNEYVWIEVPRTTAVYSNEILAYDVDNLTTEQCNEIYGELSQYANAYRQTGYIDQYNSNMGVIGNITNENDYNTLKNTMIKSIFKYGGFYIGRYEAGVGISDARSSGTQILDTSIALLSQKDKAPINYITCNQAQDLAKNVAVNSGYTSSLLFGIQWDLVLKNMETKAIAKGESIITTAGLNIFTEDSSDWGNVYNPSFIVDETAKEITASGGNNSLTNNLKPERTGKLLTTGATNRNMKQNIFDFAGNVWEYTLEYTSVSNTPICLRGGNYTNSGTYRYCAFHGNGGITQKAAKWGFRVAIY